MELTKIETKVKCDMPVCRRIAAYSVTVKGAPLSGRVNICEECVKELHSLLAKAVVPKSPENIFKKTRG